MTHREFLEQLAQEDKLLQADDSRFKTVYVNHHEGILIQDNAFCEVRGEYLVLFGEHIKPLVLDLCTVYKYAQFDCQEVLEDAQQCNLVVSDQQVCTNNPDSSKGITDT